MRKTSPNSNDATIGIRGIGVMPLFVLTFCYCSQKGYLREAGAAG